MSLIFSFTSCLPICSDHEKRMLRVYENMDVILNLSNSQSSNRSLLSITQEVPSRLLPKNWESKRLPFDFLTGRSGKKSSEIGRLKLPNYLQWRTQRRRPGGISCHSVHLFFSGSSRSYPEVSMMGPKSSIGGSPHGRHPKALLLNEAIDPSNFWLLASCARKSQHSESNFPKFLIRQWLQYAIRRKSAFESYCGNMSSANARRNYASWSSVEKCRLFKGLYSQPEL